MDRKYIEEFRNWTVWLRKDQADQVMDQLEQIAIVNNALLQEKDTRIKELEAENRNLKVDNACLSKNLEAANKMNKG